MSAAALGISSKMDKISKFLSSFEVKSPINKSPSECTKKTSKLLANQSLETYYQFSSEVKQSVEEFGGRISTFAAQGWPLPTDVYACVSRGWYMASPCILKCAGCGSILSLVLPKDTNSSGFAHAVARLSARLSTQHRPACLYAARPAPPALSRPPAVLGRAGRAVMAGEAGQLGRADCLPRLHRADLMAKMELSEGVLTAVLDGDMDEAKQTALLLLLCGWKRTSNPKVLRCELCKRNLGLWLFEQFAAKTPVETDDSVKIGDGVMSDACGESSSDVAAREKAGDSDDKDTHTPANPEVDSSESQKVPEEAGDQSLLKDSDKENLKETVENDNNKTDEGSISKKRPLEDDEESEVSAKRPRVQDGSLMEVDNSLLSVSCVESPGRPLCPLQQHRSWCGWLSTDSGVTAFVEQLGRGLERQGRLSTERYNTNVQGMRTIRSMLDSWEK